MARSGEGLRRISGAPWSMWRLTAEKSCVVDGWSCEPTTRTRKVRPKRGSVNSQKVAIVVQLKLQLEENGRGQNFEVEKHLPQMVHVCPAFCRKNKKNGLTSRRERSALRTKEQRCGAPCCLEV